MNSMLTFAEELLLLALDDRKGVIKPPSFPQHAFCPDRSPAGNYEEAYLNTLTK